MKDATKCAPFFRLRFYAQINGLTRLLDFRSEPTLLIVLGAFSILLNAVQTSGQSLCERPGRQPDVPSVTYFAQDFSSSTSVSDYVSVAPNTGQFNAIATSGAGTTVSIEDGRLQFSRSANTGSFSRTTDFSPVPSTLRYSLELTAVGNAAQTSAAVFQIGSAFGTANGAETNANVYSRFGINFGASAGTWSVRDTNSGSNSGVFSGPQTVTWFMNNSGVAVSYLAPDGTLESLADDTADLWVGTSRVFNDFASTTPGQIMTDLKFSFAAGNGTILIDNLSIEPMLTPTAARVELSGRVADATGAGIPGALIILAGPESTQLAISSPFGYYKFENIATGTYLVSVRAKARFFANSSRTMTLTDSATDVDFVAEPLE